MIVGLDARKLRDGGIGTYVRALLRLLPAAGPQDTWVALLDPADLGAAGGAGVREVAVRARKYGLGEHLAVPRAARATGVELLHEPHDTLPLGWRGPAVVTVHDLIHVLFPRFFAPGAALYARAMAGAAVRRARAVMADSEATRRDVIERLGAEAAKVTVVPLGVSPALARRDAAEVAAWRRERALPADYLLYVGARKAHKNLALLLEALARLAPAERPPLVLSGPPWSEGDPHAHLAARLRLAGAVHFAGDLGDDDALARLYSGAALYVHPALYEGFGLPPLEAMACGTPVLSSTGGALAETVGDAAVTLTPADPGAWAAAIRDLLGDRARREALVARGLARARAFTWERTAERVRAVYREALRR